MQTEKKKFAWAALLHTFRQRIGPLWWYTFILFAVQRVGDLINVFVGLWLVPKYVPQEELGAVLPLAQVGSFLGLPLTILLVPFTKYLSMYAAQGRYGKVKKMLRDMFALSGLLFLAILLYMQAVMPLVFARMRVGAGSLGFLVMTYGILCTITPVFTTSLQALKKFRLIAWFGLITAPLRLVMMLIFMPFRALSGYFVGQSTPAVTFIIVSVFSLKRQLGRAVKMESYWRNDWRQMVKYTVPVAIQLVAGTVQTAVEMFVIRHRLPDMDSAGYYVISRFAEIGGYTGMTLLFVLFPLAAESHERGDRSHRLLWHSMGGALGIGLLLAVAFYFCGGWLLGLSSAWKDYLPYTPQMALLTVICSLRSAGGCFINFEMACGRFKFVSYVTLIAVVECALLYGLTGYSFFEGVLPQAWVSWMASLNAARLGFLLQVMLWGSLLPVICMALQLLLRFRIGSRRPACG